MYIFLLAILFCLNKKVMWKIDINANGNWNPSSG